MAQRVMAGELWPALGHVALVAWKGSREAARAVHGARHVLRHATVPVLFSG